MTSSNMSLDNAPSPRRLPVRSQKAEEARVSLSAGIRFMDRYGDWIWLALFSLGGVSSIIAKRACSTALYTTAQLGVFQ